MLKGQERSQGINGVSMSNLQPLQERLSPWDEDIVVIENHHNNFTISKYNNSNSNGSDIIQKKQHDYDQQHHLMRLPRYPGKKQISNSQTSQGHRSDGLLRDFLQFCVVENSSNNLRLSNDGNDELSRKIKKNRSLEEETSNRFQTNGKSKNIHRKIQQNIKYRSEISQQCNQQSNVEEQIQQKRANNTKGNGQEEIEKFNRSQIAKPGGANQQNEETQEIQNYNNNDDRIYLEQTTTVNETTMMTEADRQDNLIHQGINNNSNLFQTLPTDISADRAKTSERTTRNSSCHNLLSIQVKSRQNEKEIINELKTCAQTLPLTIGTQNSSIMSKENQNKPGRLNNRINRTSSLCSKRCESDGARKKLMNKENVENSRKHTQYYKTEIMNTEMEDSSFNFVRKSNNLKKEQICQSSQQQQLQQNDDFLQIKDSQAAQLVKLTQNHIRLSRYRNINANRNNGSKNNGVLKEISLNNMSENATLDNNKPNRQVNQITKFECPQQQQQQKQQQQLQLNHKNQNEKPCLKQQLQQGQKQQQSYLKQSQQSQVKTNQLLQLSQMHLLKGNSENVLRLTEYPLSIAQGCISEKQLSKMLMMKKKKEKEQQIEKEFLLNLEDLPETCRRKDICSKVPITFELMNYQDIVPKNGESTENINIKISRKSSSNSRTSAYKESQLSQNQSDSKTTRWQASRKESRNGTPGKLDNNNNIRNNENQNIISTSNEQRESIMLKRRQRQQQLVCLSMLIENNTQQRQLQLPGQGNQLSNQ